MWINQQFDPHALTIIQKLLNQKMELQERMKQLEEDVKAKKTYGSSIDIRDIMLVVVVVVGVMLFQILF